ncbi:MAG: ABC transporter permease [Thermoguttaceae bacterium]|nr:ABC transporter permease [Thermoguttaceae bacterium]
MESVSKRRFAISPRLWCEWCLTLPSFVWLSLTVLLPTVMIVLVSLRAADPYGGILPGWTLDAFSNIWKSGYLPIVWRTLSYSLLTTLICVSVGLPVAWFLTHRSARVRNILLLAIIVPFWTNMLIHILAWKILLHPDGFLRSLLVHLHCIGPDVMLLNRPGTVLLLLVYVYLPFAILPLYAAVSKFNFRLLEAAQDLGASRWTTLVRVFLPGIRRGLSAAAFLVFIPSLGCYIIPDLVGGPTSGMIANKIAEKTFQARNLPEAAAISTLIFCVMLLSWIVSAVAMRAARRQASPLER